MTLVDDIVELARTPAPTFSEGPRLDLLERWLDGAPGRRWRDDAGNLLWAWGEGRPRVMVAAHVDTVFSAETELAIRAEDGALVGPGVGDNAAAVAVAVTVVRALLESAMPAPGAVAFTVQEEGLGNLRGAIAACEELEPEQFIALEGHMLESVLVGGVGSVRARVRVDGPGGHSWRDRGTASAVHALLALGGQLIELGTDDAPVNVGVVRGGRTVNAIADSAELVVERRSISQRELDGFLGDLRRLSMQEPLSVDVEILGLRPGGSVAHDHPLVRTVMDVRAELGLPQTTDVGSTDANAALARGVPALCIGVSEGSGMHSLQERIDTRSLSLGSAQLELVLRRLLIDDGAEDR